MRRPVRRIGTQLDVRIRFRGTDADGNAWNDEWISVVRISKDLKDEARRIEKALYGVPVMASRPSGRRISPRLEPIYEIEETVIGDRLQPDWTDYAPARLLALLPSPQDSDRTGTDRLHDTHHRAVRKE